MIQPSRIRDLNDHPVRPGRDYVLYWMQASQRTRFNHALEYALGRAKALARPLVVAFGLMDDYPEANERHYAFMLEGLRDVAANLAARKIKFVLRRGEPPEVAIELSKQAALVICDRGYLRHQKRWRDRVADAVDARVVQVESDAVVPVDEASDKAEFAARTIRPRLHRVLADYLVPLSARRAAIDGRRLKISSDLDPNDVAGTLSRLRIDRSVAHSRRFTGGEEAAAALLAEFVGKRLNGYAQRRNEPAAHATSTLSAYLHFGHISPLQVALAVRAATKAPAADRDALVEELIVRRELAFNYVHFASAYDRFEGLPEWARKTLRAHRRDRRAVVYSRAALEAAKTGDRYWNAAQTEMTRTGYMHNYMRMYWGKKILEWKRTPEEAYADTLYLNNKYFLCGRDPNAYANVGWIFGLHDRPWGERPIFGTIRYMNAAGLERKFDMDAYIQFVEGLESNSSDVRPAQGLPSGRWTNRRAPKWP